MHPFQTSPRDRHPARFLDRIGRGLRGRLQQLLSETGPRPVRINRMASPLVRLLEPRFVLNATAELNVMGQLLVTGSQVADSVQLQVGSVGELSLLDGSGQVIPIANHPGNPSDPLDPSAVMSGQIIFAMGDGDDILDLELPSGLSVTVTPSDGDDSTNLQFTRDGSPGPTLVDVDSQRITLESGVLFAPIDGASVHLAGDVFFGSAGATSLIDLGSGKLDIDGRFVIAGDVAVIGSEAELDLSDALITASATETSLTVNLQHPTNAEFSLGGGDESGGELVGNLSVVSASSVSLGPSPLSLQGDLVIRDVSDVTNFDSAVDADSVLVATTGDIRVDSISTAGGRISLSTYGSLTVAGDLNTAAQNTFGAINLQGQSVQLVDSQITTAGGLVNVAGPVQISGEVLVDSGNGQTADSGGRVQFFNVVQGDDAIGDTLQIDARGVILDGAVRMQGRMGASTASPGAIDLNGLDIQAGQIEVNSIGVLAGDVRLSAANVRLLGSEVRTSTDGDIVVEGALLLPIGNTSISAAGRVRFLSTVTGQAGTQDLRVTAGADALFDGTVSNVRNLDVEAQQLAQFSGSVSVSGDFEVSADTIRIAAEVDTTVTSPSGDLRLSGVTLVSVQNGAVLMTGAATIHVDAGGGVIDIGGGTLRSDSPDDAITLRDASRVILGNLVAERGNVTIGIGQDVRGVTDQAAQTRLNIDRLTASTGDSIDLTNPGNELRAIENITADGVVDIADSLFDLDVSVIDSLGNDVLLTTSESLLLAETAITAIGASTTLTAGRAILDRDDNSQANVQTGRLLLRAGAEGIGAEGIGQPNNPVDVVASISVSADTAQANGDIWLANVAGAFPIGLIDAGVGDVNLLAQTINDAADDEQTDLIARRLTMTADNGIGNQQPLELLSVSELIAVTDAGGIELDLTATTDTLVRQLAANTGDILIRHGGLRGDLPVELQSVVTKDGAITINAGGTIRAIEVLSNNVNASDDAGGNGGRESRDITLIARGMQSDILVTTVAAERAADVLLVADDDILDSDFDDANCVVADDLRLTANNRFADVSADNPTVNAEDAIKLSTNVNDFQANVTGDNRGDMRIREVDSINVAASDQKADEIVETSNGQIVISAGLKITVVDTSADDDGEDLKADPEIVARGENGRIDLQAAMEIELLDEVQLQSEQVTQISHMERPDPEPAETREMPPLMSLDEQIMSQEIRSVYLQSDSIVFGQRIEINTGVNQGVARIFAPRPIVSDDPADADVVNAFFDPTSVTTNILEQALVNDATGVLTMDIGQSGERGLTVDIDWGAKTRQFQQLNGLSADKAISVVVDFVGEPQTPTVSSSGDPLLVVEHFYTEADVLDSRENLRESATDPLEVRFSVRHHESILVIGNTVQQAPAAESIVVPGQVVSSTDDPATLREKPSGLENGVASFVIPNLTIPVAFFPVREVIPELETPKFVVRSESIVALTQSTFETTETTASSIVSRVESFRIRVLSPDPDGEDLAPPQELPDDILSGDKVKKLFEELPDGRYEIEYLLGDGNARSILRVDVRGGEATIPGDELDEGVLKLKRILPESDNEKEMDGESETDSEPGTDGRKIDQSVEELPWPDEELPTGLEGEQDTRESSLPPVAAAVALTSTLQRRFNRNQKKRLSAAGRFAARSQQSGRSGVSVSD